MATYYISPSGNDSTGSGTSGEPWLTISKAHTSTSGGDTIICKDGTYTWASQAFTKILTIRAENTGLVIFDGAGAALQWFVQADVTLTGLRFTNATGATNQPVFRAEISLTFTFNYCRFDAIQVHGLANGGTGGLFGQNLGGTGSPIFAVNACIFDDVYMMSSSSDYYLFGARLDVVNRVITYTLTNCVLYFSVSSSQRVRFLWYKAFPASGANVVITVKNSIIYNNTGSTLTYSSGSGITSALSYSCFCNITSTPAGTALITSDPLFIDAANDNFNLRPTSPCINTGTLV